MAKKNPVGDTVDQKLRASAVRKHFRAFKKKLDPKSAPKAVREAVDHQEDWWHSKISPYTGRKLKKTQFTSDPMGYISDASIVFVDVARSLEKGKVKLDSFPLDEFHAWEDSLKRAEGTMRAASKWDRKRGSPMHYWAPDGGPMAPGYLTRSRPPYDWDADRKAGIVKPRKGRKISKKNPEGMNPATKQKLMIGGGVAVLGWTAWRMSTRASLVRMLDEDPLIEAGRSYYGSSLVPVPPGAEWLADPDGNRQRAAQVISFFGTANALQGYGQIMDEMPPLPPEVVAASPNALDAIMQEFERATGVDLPDVDLPPVEDLLKNIIG